MRTNSARRLLAVLVASVITAVATIIGGAAPAHAAASGYLLIKGTGSVYTANDIVNLGVTPGTSKTWGFKVVNTGSTPQQYKVEVSLSHPSNMATTLLAGSMAVPVPYFTVPVAPGKSVALSLKVFVDAGVAQNEYTATVAVRDPLSNALVDSAVADANATYQTGNTRHDLFLKTGSQPYVGGSVTQFETASTLKVGNTASYTLRLKNDSGTPTAIGLDGTETPNCPGNFSVVVKQGSTNVTTAVYAGTYSTGVLAPGAKVELKLTIKLVSATTCTGSYFVFQSSAPDGSVYQYAHVVTGA